MALLVLGPWRERTSRWWEHVEEAAHLMADRKQRKWKGLGTRYNLQRHPPSDLLPSAKPHLLKFLEPPKVMDLTTS
jgi:hypothetical protein